jgi:PAS domain S-box-containing protein
MAVGNREFDRYHRYVQRRLTALTPVFAKAAVGNFSSRVRIPQTEDEFTQLYVGIQIILEVIREKLTDLERVGHERAARANELKAKVEELEKTKRQLLTALSDLEDSRRQIVQENARDNAILTSIGDGLFATDANERIIRTNAQALTATGWRSGEVLGKKYTEYFTLVDADGAPTGANKRPVAVALKTGKRSRTTAEMDLFFRRKDGSTFPVVVTASPVRVGNRVVGTVEVFRDITQEKAIDRAKSEFVSLASHQLRTPLTIVKWGTEHLLGNRALPPETLEYLRNIHHANRRMIELVDAFLNVSRIELGTFAIRPEPTDLVSVAESVRVELSPLIEAHRLTVKTTYDPALPRLMVDPKLFRVVVQNLLSNAVKYTTPGGRIQITLRRGVREIVLSVSDTGVGIPAAAKSHIFTKLFRADNVSRLDPSGTGLGLYIVKGIVERSGGWIGFTSKEQRGTTFTVHLPPKGMPAREGTKGLTAG